MTTVRLEQHSGCGIGQQKTSSLQVTRDGEELTVGRWLTTKILKNSLIESSHTQVEHRLFRYKAGVCFDKGISFTLALSKMGMTKGPISFASSKKNKILLPSGKVLEVSFREFHQMLVSNKELHDSLYKAIIDHANKNAVMFRQDV
jgi:hypothetical protein